MPFLLLCVALGLPSSLGNGVWSGITIIGLNFLDFFDFISNSILMPVVAILTCLFVGYVIKQHTLIEEAEQHGVVMKSKKLFTVVIKYIAPVCIALILMTSIMEILGIIKI